MTARPRAARETAFAAALGQAETPPPHGVAAPGGGPADRRFAVYRNNVVAGRVETLAAAFPGTATLVGEDFFHAAARAFAADTPPTSPLLFRYGAGLPDFLSRLPGLASYPYVADVARTEWARLQALHAADAAPLDPAALGAVPPDRLVAARLAPHPALAIVPSTFPVVSILRRALGEDATTGALPAGAEWAVVARPDMEVAAHAAEPASGRCLAALAAGRTIGEAAAEGEAAGPGFDLSGAIALALAAGAFARVDPPS